MSRDQRPSPRRRAGLIAAGAVQLGLAAVAAVDLARRSPAQVRGPKWRWALALAVNYFGPLAYLCWGRVPPRAATQGSGPPGPPRP